MNETDGKYDEAVSNHDTEKARLLELAAQPTEGHRVAMEHEHSVAMARRKLSDLLEAARLLMEWEPKSAAATYGKAHEASKEWSKLVEGEG